MKKKGAYANNPIQSLLSHVCVLGLLLMITQSGTLYGQVTPPIWVSTGEFVAPAFSLETPNRYVLGMLECKIKDNGTLGDPFTAWGSILLSTDKNLTKIDSVYVKFIDNWYIMLYQGLVLNNGHILLAGPAFHPDSNEKKLGLIWMDESLNILQQSLYGLDGKKIEPSGSIILNQSGNIVTYGNVVENYCSGQWFNHYYFMEISQSGETIQIKEQTLEHNAFYLWPVGNNKYQMWSWFNIVLQLDANFGFESTFSLGLPHEFLGARIQPYNFQSYFIIRDKMKFVPGYSQPISEIEVLQVNDQANIINTFVIGFEGQDARGASISSYNPGVLFVGGTKYQRDNHQTPSVNFNQIFIYKTATSGQLLHSAFFSTTSGIACGSLMATSDGGCLIPVTYYNTYPSQDALYLKMDASGNIVGLINHLSYRMEAYSIFPMPARSHLTIQSTSVLPTTATIYSLEGALVKSFRFEGVCRLDMASLKPGVYLMQLDRSDGYREIKKVIISK